MLGMFASVSLYMFTVSNTLLMFKATVITHMLSRPCIVEAFCDLVAEAVQSSVCCVFMFKPMWTRNVWNVFCYVW